jgi:hypothetical protein
MDVCQVWAPVAGGKLFRSIRNGRVWGSGITQNVVWYVVKACAGGAQASNRALLMICVGRAPACAIRREENWNRSSFFSDMRLSRRLSGTSDVSKHSAGQ